MYKTVVFNGNYMRFMGNTRGRERYTKEILHALDKMVDKGKVKVLVPGKTREIDHFENIEVVRYCGNWKTYKWEILGQQLYIWKYRAFSVFLSEGNPYFSIGIFALHDTIRPEGLKRFKSRYLLESFKHWWAIHTAKHIVTVSEYSKNEISKKYKIPPQKITVCYNGWQHFQNVSIDEGIFSKHPEIIRGEYYFVCGGREKNKNLVWIYKMALKYPDRKFVFAGPEYEPIANDPIASYGDEHNCIHLGFISDEEVKALMANCRAFLFPSKKEGFGIPPLEALSCGAKVFLSNASCLPEIYKDYAAYFDPDDYDVDLDRLEKQECKPAEELLAFYSWDRSAAIIKDLIETYSGIDLGG